MDREEYYPIQFWIFLILLIPSIISSLFVLYYFLIDRNLRKSLHNHMIILILIINLFYEFTDMIWFIHYFRYFNNLSLSSTFRLIWGFIDWTIYSFQLILYAWITIERHILIFHDQLIATRKKRFFIHYFPPILIIIYCLVYYLIIFFALECTNDFESIMTPSMVPCAFDNNSLSIYDTVAHTIVPTLIIIISSCILLLRILYQKYRIHQQIHWRRHRSMTIQVLSFSSLYLFFSFPYSITTIFILLGISSPIGPIFLSYYMYCTYYVFLLFPIVCLGSLPQLRQKFNKILNCHRQNRVNITRILPGVRMTSNRVIIQ